MVVGYYPVPARHLNTLDQSKYSIQQKVGSRAPPGLHATATEYIQDALSFSEVLVLDPDCRCYQKQ